MKLIAEICQDKEIKCKQFKLRRKVRVILLDDDNRIAVMNITKAGFHILPGGGIDGNETNAEACYRECLEEVGASIEILCELGLTITQRNTDARLNFDYCYVAKVIGNLQSVSFTEGEIFGGYKLEWYDINDAILIFKEEEKKQYSSEWAKYLDAKNFTEDMKNLEFIKHKPVVERELAILKEYHENYMNGINIKTI
ncbi:MAG: NUDIX hydrolase [Firmicutes bacterium]|nr:NUDIX hydrolase [Bacillota bacterium]